MNFIRFADGEEEVATCQAVILRGLIEEPPQTVAGHDLMMETVVAGHPQPGAIFLTTSEKGRGPISIDELANSSNILIFVVKARKQIGVEVRYAGCFGNKELEFKGPTASFVIPYSIPKFLQVQFGTNEGWQVEGQVSRAVRAAMDKHDITKSQITGKGENRGGGTWDNRAQPQGSRGGGGAQQLQGGGLQYPQVGGSQHPGGQGEGSYGGRVGSQRDGGGQLLNHQGGGSQYPQGGGSQYPGGQGYGSYGGGVGSNREGGGQLPNHQGGGSQYPQGGGSQYPGGQGHGGYGSEIGSQDHGSC
jgi:hypothetical protein